MPAFDDLMKRIESEPYVEGAVETLVLGLADRIRATSNDQNIQTLARRLRESAATIAASVRTKLPA